MSAEQGSPLKLSDQQRKQVTNALAASVQISSGLP
jgi:hypothetical protein